MLQERTLVSKAFGDDLDRIVIVESFQGKEGSESIMKRYASGGVEERGFKCCKFLGQNLHYLYHTRL